jgi:hypothetical protein
MNRIEGWFVRAAGHAADAFMSTRPHTIEGGGEDPQAVERLAERCNAY